MSSTGNSPRKIAKRQRSNYRYWARRYGTCCDVAAQYQQARENLRRVGCKNAADYLSRALKSLLGAKNHALSQMRRIEREQLAALRS